MSKEKQKMPENEKKSSGDTSLPRNPVGEDWGDAGFGADFKTPLDENRQKGW